MEERENERSELRHLCRMCLRSECPLSSVSVLSLVSMVIVKDPQYSTSRYTQTPRWSTLGGLCALLITGISNPMWTSVTFSGSRNEGVLMRISLRCIREVAQFFHRTSCQMSHTKRAIPAVIQPRGRVGLGTSLDACSEFCALWFTASSSSVSSSYGSLLLGCHLTDVNEVIFFILFCSH